MLRFLALGSLLLIVAVAAVAQPVQHSDVWLYPSSRAALAPLGLDHVAPEVTPDGLAYRAVLSETELAAVRLAGVRVEVLTADLAEALAARPPFTAAEQAASRAGSRIEHSVFGSVLGYPSFDEVVAQLDSMRTLYPALISARMSLGQSVEGRDVWMVEISDSPGLDEGEPEALYTAIHHAREPQGMATVLYFMWYLLEQYGTNADITTLVDSRRLFFVPVLNPDGYAYNEVLADNGQYPGWRKNCRVNDDGGLCCTLANEGTCGVDLNRNYGYLWGYDDIGSSPDQGSATYRGAGPFSEPETAALRDFLESGRRVSIALNYHTYSNLLLYPWGYEEGAYTPDSLAFVTQSQAMTALNNYTYGTGSDILYPVNGDADDWMYGEQATKPKILAYTPEVGSGADGFWPDPSRIIPLADENLEMNLLVAEFADGTPVSHEADAPVSLGFGLEATRPNPFQATTTLVYTLDEPAAISLVVYDVLGREVAVLREGDEQAGRHTAMFDASGLPTGLYVARLVVEGVTRSRSMLLMR